MRKAGAKLLRLFRYDEPRLSLSEVRCVSWISRPLSNIVAACEASPAAKRKPQPGGCGLNYTGMKSNYRLSLRRNRPASPITPEPNSIMLPGSGTVLVL